MFSIFLFSFLLKSCGLKWTVILLYWMDHSVFDISVIDFVWPQLPLLCLVLPMLKSQVWKFALKTFFLSSWWSGFIDADGWKTWHSDTWLKKLHLQRRPISCPKRTSTFVCECIYVVKLNGSLLLLYCTSVDKWRFFNVVNVLYMATISGVRLSMFVLLCNFSFPPNTVIVNLKTWQEK